MRGGRPYRQAWLVVKSASVQGEFDGGSDTSIDLYYLAR